MSDSNSKREGHEGVPFVRLVDSGRPRSASAIAAEVEALRQELADIQRAFQTLTDFAQRARLEQKILKLREEFEGKLFEYMRELARANEELAVTNNLFRALADSVEDIVFVKDRESRFLLCNQACAALLDVTPDALVGTTGAQCLPPETMKQVLEQDRRVIESGERLQYQETIWISSTTQRSFFTTKIPFHDILGRVAGLLGIARDRTRDKA